MAAAGRPRSEESHQAILRAAFDLLDEDGLARFTFERVAAKAGVSRSTIYRWWPSKEALAMESALGALLEEVKFTHGPSAIGNIRTRLRLVAQAMKGRPGRFIAAMLAAGQQDPAALQIFIDGYIEPARRNVRALLHQAIAQGALSADFDIEMAIDISFGSLYHQLLLRRTLEAEWVDRLNDMIFAGALIQP